MYLSKDKAEEVNGLPYIIGGLMTGGLAGKGAYDLHRLGEKAQDWSTKMQEAELLKRYPTVAGGHVLAVSPEATDEIFKIYSDGAKSLARHRVLGIPSGLIADTATSAGRALSVLPRLHKLRLHKHMSDFISPRKFAPLGGDGKGHKWSHVEFYGKEDNAAKLLQHHLRDFTHQAELRDFLFGSKNGTGLTDEAKSLGLTDEDFSISKLFRGLENKVKTTTGASQQKYKKVLDALSWDLGTNDITKGLGNALSMSKAISGEMGFADKYSRVAKRVAKIKHPLAALAMMGLGAAGYGAHQELSK